MSRLMSRLFKALHPLRVYGSPMGNHLSDLLARASAASIPVVRGVTDDQFGLPTPCAEFSVRDLLNHLFQVVVNFQALAAREPADFSGTPDVLDGDWRERYVAETEALVKAWAEPSSLDGVSPGMGLPQPVVAKLVLLDLTVHSWDLAQATGQPYSPDAQSVQELLGLVDQMGPMARENGVFGAEVPVSGGPFETLLGATGRHPVVPPR